MSQFNVTGMMCAACSARVEKAVNAVPGVEKCSVNLLTNSMTVEGTATDKDIIAAVKKAGYGIKAPKDEKSHKEGDLEDKETNKILLRLVSSLVIVGVLMYIAMGHMLSLPHATPSLQRRRHPQHPYPPPTHCRLTRILTQASGTATASATVLQTVL